MHYCILEFRAGGIRAHGQPAGAGHRLERVCDWGTVGPAFRRPTNVRSITFPRDGLGKRQSGVLVTARRLLAINVSSTTLNEVAVPYETVRPRDLCVGAIA